MNETVKHVGDMAAGGLTVATLVGALPSIAALFSIIYVCIRLYWDWSDRRKRYADE